MAMLTENGVQSHEGPTNGNMPDTSTSLKDESHRNGLAAPDKTHLPSPSPTPSPRIMLPALITESVGVEKKTLAAAPNRHMNSEAPEHNINILPNVDENEEATPASSHSTILPPHEFIDIPEEKSRKYRRPSAGKGYEVLKLSAAEMEELTSAPESLPIASPTRLPLSAQQFLAPSPMFDQKAVLSEAGQSEPEDVKVRHRKVSAPEPSSRPESTRERRPSSDAPSNSTFKRPGFSSRAISTPPAVSNRMSSYSKSNAGQTSPKRRPLATGLRPDPLDLNHSTSKKPAGGAKSSQDLPSPLPQNIPLPPMSIPTYLQLELSSTRPSPLYIYRSSASEYPYESSKVKFERLYNFLILAPQLEQVLLFGTLACLDAWLHTFTILPLRFFKALAILVQWWGQILVREAKFISGFIYHGSGRMWHRRRERRDSGSRSRSTSRAGRPSVSTASSYQSQLGRTPELGNQNGIMDSLRADSDRKSRPGWGRKHRRSKSQPSSLSSYHKGDLLQGAVVVFSCIILMKLDASRMYHSIRGQAALKLYVIFNALEVCDKLLGALGQDIFECLFSNETLERDLDGRSKILRPLGMFVLALIYNVVHATSLFYQVVALNVAINSYSNALMTLLISNQFVEIKSSVFKKIEKDNLFQLTCADIVERFQLWLILTIIALRNIVEVGGLSVLAGGEGDMMGEATAPLRSNSILPDSFTILPNWSGEVLSPFILVLGSEMLVDWMKHAFITKFNNVKPAIYGRYLDVLAKDYYTNAFVNQNLIKRLGLPVIPLACLFIRSSVQTYHMFLATHLPNPIPSTATSLSVEEATTSPATTAALEHFDNIIRRALGRSTFGIPNPTATNPWYLPSTDDVIATLTMLVFFLGAFFVLLAFKLVLGMLLLKFSRNRYRRMKKQEHQRLDTEGKRLGTWGMTEVDDDKKRWIYDDDPETLRKLKEKEKGWKEKAAAPQDFGKISRYEMVKRIW